MLEMLSAVPDSCTHGRAQHPPPHKVLLVRQAYGSSSPLNPSPFLVRVGGKPARAWEDCGGWQAWVQQAQSSPAGRVRPRRTPMGPGGPEGCVQLPPAVWKHVLCPALTQHFESRRVTELANSTVWKRRVGAHCRQVSP